MSGLIKRLSSIGVPRLRLHDLLTPPWIPFTLVGLDSTLTLHHILLFKVLMKRRHVSIYVLENTEKVRPIAGPDSPNIRVVLALCT